MNKIWWRIATALSIVFVLSTAYLLLPQTFLSLDNRLRDFLFVLRGPLPVQNPVVIVDIDEASLQAEGQWPWSRNKVARLIQNLSDAEAGIIGLDMVFSEEDKSSPHAVVTQLPSFQGVAENYDEQLARTIASTPTVGGYFFTHDRGEKSEAPLIPAVFIERSANTRAYVITPEHLVLNIPVIQDAFYSSGFFNSTHDEGGMIRRTPLVMRYDGTIYPSLDLEMVRIFTAAREVYVNNSVTGVESIDLGELHIPTDRFAHLMINYRGAQNTFAYISAKEVLNGTFNKNDIAGKFVLVGTSAIGLSDLKATPFDTAMPGVEVHANVIDNLLTGDFIALPENTELADLLIIAVIVVAMMMIFSSVNAWALLPLLLASGYGLYLFFMQMLFKEGMVLNILFPFTALVLSFIAAVLLNYIVSLRQKKIIMSMFAKKVSPSVMHDLIRNRSEHLLQPRSREVTVLFSDIRSFTEISERLADPERVITMLNTYMTPMVESITEHQGTVDKFIGDAVMAYWNAPVDVPAHADKAVASALQQLHLLQTLNIRLEKSFGVNLDVGFGIHTGKVTIGEMGSTGRSDYTIIGDTVNLASRLEGLTKIYGVSIIISLQTRSRLNLDCQVRSLDIVKVKGKKEAVEIFEVLPPKKRIAEDEMQRYENALTLYRAGKLEEATGAFAELDSRCPSTLYALYLDRCHKATREEKSRFDPVVTMQTK